MIVISIKYIVFVMRADNRGEGGILALTALIFPPGGPQRYNRRYLLVLLGIFSTALLYGDGMITPAISVLSAVEGLTVVNSGMTPWVLPIAIDHKKQLLTVAMADTTNVVALDQLRAILGGRVDVHPLLAGESEIETAVLPSVKVVA